jgi:hypothetical protein
MFDEAGRDARSLSKLLSTKELVPHLFRYVRSNEQLRVSRERNMEA